VGEATRKATMRSVVADAGPLIHLHEANALELLDVLGHVYVPQAVADEVTCVIGSRWQEGVTLVNLDERTSLRSQMLLRTAGLHRGEAEAIALAGNTKGSLLLSDDAAARLYASYINIEVRGSLGLVLAAVVFGSIDKQKGRQVLERLRKSSLWISNAIFCEALSALEGQPPTRL
jgi:predicted nucleic acid-binding protein